LKAQDLLDRTPHVSIVTINFNHLKDLQKTFANVVSQTYKNIEYIIIDGGSQDGIYDAMNKGTKVARGEWLIFMNSGDIFSQENTIEQVAPYLDRVNDVVYGGYESITDDRYGYRVSYRQPSDLSLIWHQIPTCHQSVFVRRELQSQYPFDTSFSWCADHDFLAQLYQLGAKFQEIPTIVAKFDASGGVPRDLLTYTRERWSICRKYFGKTREQELFFLNEYRAFWLQKNLNERIRNIIPKEWVVASRKLRKIY
jgi:glycosyltransferase involved in cell wall biosynthesis